MPSWFSKVFKSEPGTAVARPPAPRPAPLALDPEDLEDEKPRRVINAPVLAGDEELSAFSEEVRIKAKMDEKNDSCLFLIDRPVLEGHSFYAGDRATAAAHSPLAAAIFDLGGIGGVTLHGFTLNVKRDGTGHDTWESKAKAIAAQVRAHLKSGMPVMAPEWLDKLPPENVVRQAVQDVIDREINPGIAGHSGYITLNRVQGNTVYITMGGGCQGCAASSITLRSGVEKTFRDAVPMLGAVLDETDHASGTNPFFKQLPVGMGA